MIAVSLVWLGLVGVGLLGLFGRRVAGRGPGWGCLGAGFVSGGDPSGGGGAQAEDGEACEVGGGGEEVEVGVDFRGSSDAGLSSAVAAAHHVAEFAFDFGAGGPVVVLPWLVLLAFAGRGESGLVDADTDGAPVRGLGAGLA